MCFPGLIPSCAIVQLWNLPQAWKWNGVLFDNVHHSALNPFLHGCYDPGDPHAEDPPPVRSTDHFCFARRRSTRWRAGCRPLTVYSGRSEGLIGPILEQFTAETGVPVEVRYGSTAEMAATILEEGDNSPADVYIAQDAGALGALAEAGRLAELTPETIALVPAAFASPDNVWVGLSGRARVLVYNTEMLTEEDLPASIADLANPEWAGRVGWAPTNASLQSHVTALRLLLGEDATRAWLEAMVANGTQTYENNTSVVQAVIDGEAEVGLVNHYYLFGFLADDPDVPAANYFFPDGDPGSLINIAGAGVLTTSDQPEAAEALIAWLLGETAQRYFAEETFEYPMIEGVEIDERLTPLSELQTPEIDLSDLSDLEASLELLSETGALP
ncbi:MAG: iron ABC transporter substrate-binding protein [Chloroflexi bacterium]|nr:iron ABC transporter substrate-binding protein [Chloroflexota bacterium]